MSYIHWLRSQIGSQKTILVYSTIILSDSRGRILLQQRSDFPWWGLPGGILEFGEDILSCARRELHEETGLEAADLHLVGVYTDPRYDVTYPNGDQVQQFSVCFTGMIGGGVVRPDGEEIIKLEFIDPRALPEMNIPIWYRAMIDDMFHAAEPAFEWNEAHAKLPVADGDVASSPCLRERTICPASVAVVQRHDGRLLLPGNQLGEREFPVVAIELGETAAAAAVRATATHSHMVNQPTRLLGVASRPGWLNPTSMSTGQSVATVFLFDDRDPTGIGYSDADWLAPHDLMAVAGPQHAPLYAQIAATLAGGYFIDEQQSYYV